MHTHTHAHTHTHTHCLSVVLRFKHGFARVMQRKPTVCTMLSLLQHYAVVLYRPLCGHRHCAEHGAAHN